jgi:hypothetical protein
VQGTPASVGLDEAALAGFDKDLASGKYMLVDSFELFRCGREVFARKYTHDYGRIYGAEAKTKGPLNAHLTGPYNYFDPDWHPYYHGTDMHTMQSVSKTVTSVIYGVATTRGDFKADLDTPVLKFFDASKVKNVDDRKRRMTLKHVLTMTTGLDWKRPTTGCNTWSTSQWLKSPGKFSTTAAEQANCLPTSFRGKRGRILTYMERNTFSQRWA